ncbi:MAG TPA: hypothetical protein VHU18_05970 [Rhizomicrobium sp.]|jgi:hypothetical protein|nr:hypothetical protein [Rhizomicrobium sp.]
MIRVRVHCDGRRFTARAMGVTSHAYGRDAIERALSANLMQSGIPDCAIRFFWDDRTCSERASFYDLAKPSSRLAA